MFKHVVPTDYDRSLEVSVSAVAVRITCDAPGIAAVSHSLTWAEWRDLVATIDASWPEAPIA